MTAFGESVGSEENEFALDRFVRDLHGEANTHTTFDIWNQFKAIYPLMGGTAFAHSLNLIDQSMFGITWSGSPTHNSNGVSFDGVSQHGNTGLNPTTHLMTYNKAAVAYVDDLGSSPLPWLFGAWDSEGKIFAIRRNTDGSLNSVGVNDIQSVASNTWATKNMSIDISDAPIAARVFDNGAVKTVLTPFNANPNTNVTLGGLRNIIFTACRFKFLAISNTLSTLQHASLAISINNLQTALGRA